MTALTLDPIGYIDGCYPDKFGIPRQPGLAPSATAEVVLTGEYAQPESIRGIETYSHLWITFVFHLSPTQWRPLIRPPRLGGNRKVGVFASRSTHRPNRLGQSLVELIATDTTQGVRLKIRGHDLVNGTPVVDIKPYLPWVESIPGARAGLAPEAPSLLKVIFAEKAIRQLINSRDSATLRSLIEEVLAQDPRPAYHQSSGNPVSITQGISTEAFDKEVDREATGRVYGVKLMQKDIHFRVIQSAGNDVIEVIDIEDIVRR